MVFEPPVLIAGGGIGGLAVALGLAQKGFRAILLEKASALGEIGAGIQLGPNAFSALDALGVGERARARAVYTDRLVMMDAIDESEVASVPVGEAFRRRFGNPYAVSHRADVHQSLVEGVEGREAIELVKLQGLSTEAAAARVGTTPGALRVRAHRAYSALRRLLGS